MNLMEQLERLDLKGRQAKVYLALLQLGSASAIEIAKYTKLKHPTVYDVLDLLREKQLVCETVSGRRRLFSPEDPARLAEIENRRKEALDAVLPDLYALYRGGENVRVFTTMRGPKGARHSVPLCSTSRRKSIFISARSARC